MSDDDRAPRVVIRRDSQGNYKSISIGDAELPWYTSPELRYEFTPDGIGMLHVSYIVSGFTEITDEV